MSLKPIPHPSHKELVLPEQYNARLESLVRELEALQGDQYEITLKKFSNQTPLVFGAFKERQCIVYNMSEKYKDLEGSYSSTSKLYKVMHEKYPNDGLMCSESSGCICSGYYGGICLTKDTGKFKLSPL